MMVTWTAMYSTPEAILAGRDPTTVTGTMVHGTVTDGAASVGVDDVVASRGRGAAWAGYDGDGFLELL
jgi:hypothetical protein